MECCVGRGAAQSGCCQTPLPAHPPDPREHREEAAQAGSRNLSSHAWVASAVHGWGQPLALSASRMKVSEQGPSSEVTGPGHRSQGLALCVWQGGTVGRQAHQTAALHS